MKCETAQQVFSEYYEETIERPLVLTLEHHLKQCEECRQAYGSFRSTWRTLDSFPLVQPPSDFRESVLARIKAQQETTPRKSTTWRTNLGNVFGARVPTRAFAWAFSVLIFAVLLVRVTPGVYQSTSAGLAGGPWGLPKGPGMDVSVRVSDAGTYEDRYQITLKPMTGVGQIDAEVCVFRNGAEISRTIVRKPVVPVSIKHPQDAPVDAEVRWNYGGQTHSRIIFLPRSQTVSRPPYIQSWNDDIHDVLRQIATEYGVVVSADAGLKGRVNLSGKFYDAKSVLDQVAAKAKLRVRKEGSCVFELEPR
jgi:hypothetical protein